MKASNISRLALVFLISLALVGPAEAQERNRRDRQEDRLHMLDHVLDLTAEQEAAIKKIREEGEAKAKAARAESKAAFDAVLTDAQKAELEEWQSEHGNRFVKRSKGRRNARAFRGGQSNRRGGSAVRGRGLRGGDRGAGLMGRALRQLDLTDAQEEQFKALREGQQESMKAMRESMKDMNREERAEAMKAQRDASEAKVAEILTDEQEEKLAEMKEKREKRSRRGQRSRRGGRR